MKDSLHPPSSCSRSVRVFLATGFASKSTRLHRRHRRRTCPRSRSRERSDPSGPFSCPLMKKASHLERRRRPNGKPWKKIWASDDLLRKPITDTCLTFYGASETDAFAMTEHGRTSPVTEARASARFCRRHQCRSGRRIAVGCDNLDGLRGKRPTDWKMCRCRSKTVRT